MKLEKYKNCCKLVIIIITNWEDGWLEGPEEGLLLGLDGRYVGRLEGRYVGRGEGRFDGASVGRAEGRLERKKIYITFVI